MTEDTKQLPTPTPLNAEERDLLTQCEHMISGNFPAFLEVGSALLSIQEGKLYREKYTTFGDYTEQAWGWSRQRAYQLIDAVEVSNKLTEVGLPEPANERQARDLKIVTQLPLESAQAVANYIKATTGTETPTTSQIKAAAELAQSIDAHATVQNPDTGEEVKFSSLTGVQRAVILTENATNSTYERLQRQQEHIKSSIASKAQASGIPNWTDWIMNYAQQSLTDTQELRIVVKRDVSGNAQATALIVDTESHATVAFADNAAYLKKAVLNLIEELKG